MRTKINFYSNHSKGYMVTPEIRLSKMGKEEKALEHQRIRLMKEKADKILSLIAEEYHLTREDLMREERDWIILEPRQIGMYCMRHLIEGITLYNISEYFHKCHGAIHNSINTIDDRMDVDLKFRYHVLELLMRCRTLISAH